MVNTFKITNIQKETHLKIYYNTNYHLTKKKKK